MTTARKKKKPAKKVARRRKTPRARVRARVKPRGSRRAAGPKRTARRVSVRRRARPPARRRARPSSAGKTRLRVTQGRAPSGVSAARGKARPALRVVGAPRPVRAGKRTAEKPSPFPQRAGASAKQLLLFELLRARATVLAAIHGLSPASANEPMGEGRWSVREAVLHLITRDQARLRESESTLHGQPASWKGVQEAAMGALNAELMAPLRHLDWEDALRTLHRVREQLMEEVESVPEEPAEVWSPEHPFGWMLHVLPPHDRHHADSIKRWRLERAL